MTRRTKPTMPERIEMNAVLPRGEAGYWSIILDLDKKGGWTVPMIVGETIAARTGVVRYVNNLVKAGIAVRTEVPGGASFKSNIYRLVKRQKDAPRVRGDGTLIVSTQQECMWRTIRTLRAGFTVRELAFNASMPGQKIKDAAALNYIEALDRAGYLSLVQQTERTGRKTWRLKASMNTGPLSPTLYRIDGLYDRNLKKIVGEPSAREVAA
jgi:hypothetical protein